MIVGCRYPNLANVYSFFAVLPVKILIINLMELHIQFPYRVLSPDEEDACCLKK